MLSLKKAVVNLGHFGALLDFIGSTMTLFITSKFLKQPLATLEEAAALLEMRSPAASS